MGIYRFAKDLVRALGRGHPGSMDVFVLGNDRNSSDFRVPGVAFVDADTNPGSRWNTLRWELSGVNRYLRSIRADVAVFPRGFAPLRCAAPALIVVHDLIPFYYREHYPRYFPRGESLYIRRRLAASIKSADTVVSVSRFSAQEIVRRMPGIDPAKIVVIHNGLTPTNVTSSGARHHILAMASKYPHKNYPVLLEAYGEYRRRSNAPMPLVVVGETGSTESQTDRAGVEELGYVDPYHLQRLFVRAAAFVFLSKIEGFGYPPLEAMSYGVPVICSRTGAIPEIVGDGALLVDPQDVRGAAGALSRVLSDKRLADRLVARGFHVLRRYNWDDKVTEYLSAIERTGR
jgi:glycosyltransferase involved in cell wall biosynthesis